MNRTAGDSSDSEDSEGLRPPLRSSPPKEKCRLSRASARKVLSAGASCNLRLGRGRASVRPFAGTGAGPSATAPRDAESRRAERGCFDGFESVERTRKRGLSGSVRESFGDRDSPVTLGICPVRRKRTRRVAARRRTSLVRSVDRTTTHPGSCVRRSRRPQGMRLRPARYTTPTIPNSGSWPAARA